MWLWNNLPDMHVLPFKPPCVVFGGGGGGGGGVDVLPVGRNTYWLPSLVSAPFCHLVLADEIVMNRGRSMFYFVFDFKIDQISFMTLTSDFHRSHATVSPFWQRLDTISWPLRWTRSSFYYRTLIKVYYGHTFVGSCGNSKLSVLLLCKSFRLPTRGRSILTRSTFTSLLISIQLHWQKSRWVSVAGCRRGSWMKRDCLA